MNTWWNRNGGLDGAAGFVACLVVVLAVVYWKVILAVIAAVAAVALLIGVIFYTSIWGDKVIAKNNANRAAAARKYSAIIARADQQHAAIMAGNEHLGTYGKYPPSKGI